MMDIRKELEKRILILDGAMGTRLQEFNLGENDFRGMEWKDHDIQLAGNNECLNITHPDIIESIHQSYAEAGADIISSNTFSANRISQQEYGLEEYAARMALEGARAARRVADRVTVLFGRKVWVAGSVGPTGKSLTLAPDINRQDYRPWSFDQMAEAYREQVQALIEGGVDIILLETFFDSLNAKAAIYAIREIAPDIPLMISATVSDKSGRTLTGQTLEAFYHSISHASVLSFGVNCAMGAKDLEPIMEELSKVVDCALSCHPNAGLPDEMGRYTQSPESMSLAMLEMAEKGFLNIAGGCCGTTTEHIRAIAGKLGNMKPRSIRQRSEILTVSGLESVSISQDEGRMLVNVGERTNVAGSRKFARLVASGEYETALHIAAEQIKGGANIIDINMDDAMLDSTLEMRHFLRYISGDPSVAKAALMIDSSHWETILEGLKNAPGKCIVNSISLKEGPEAFIAKARTISRLGGAMVVMAFDEEGQACSYERKIEICRRAYALLTKEAGVRPEDIIFDVNVLSIGTGLDEHRRYAVDFIEAVRWIKQNLKGALTSGGISNLSFAFRGNNAIREAMHSVFLYHAAAAGLDMGIVNPSMLQVYDQIDPVLLKLVEDVIFDRSDDATQKLLDYASTSVTREAEQDRSRSESTQINNAERLTQALVKGSSSTLEEDVMECLKLYCKAVNVIEGPLMDGMKKVGEYFGEGKMFLPQVVKSARIMRDAVSILSPYIDSDKDNGESVRPKIVIATVKGDVHDIGKNITAIVLRCNGFDVTDLGVMVAKETILSEAERIGADIIAVSGLITPSLREMEELCREMAARGMSTPLFVGGATTSALHTAVRLAPLYNHVFHGSDASASAVLCKQIVSDREAFERTQHLAQQKIRELYKVPEKGIEAPAFPLESFPRDLSLSPVPVSEISVELLKEHFDWKMFYAIWRVRMDAELRRDAEALIERIIRENLLSVRVSLSWFDANSEGEDIVFQNGLRIASARDRSGRCIADYVAPSASGFTSKVGVTGIAVHMKAEEGHGLACSCPACRSSYESLLMHSVRVTLAEAASAWIESRINSELQGEKLIKPAIGYTCIPDHSLKVKALEMIPRSNELEISFTESYAMIPESSICSLVIIHPEAKY